MIRIILIIVLFAMGCSIILAQQKPLDLNRDRDKKLDDLRRLCIQKANIKVDLAGCVKNPKEYLLCQEIRRVYFDYPCTYDKYFRTPKEKLLSWSEDRVYGTRVFVNARKWIAAKSLDEI